MSVLHQHRPNHSRSNRSAGLGDWVDKEPPRGSSGVCITSPPPPVCLMRPCLRPDPGGENSLRAGPASLHQPGRCSLVLPPLAQLTAPLPEAIHFQRLETLARHLQSGLHRGHCFPEVWAEHLIESSHPPPPHPARPVPLASLIPEYSSLPDTLSLVFTLLLYFPSPTTRLPL